jgi:hypothetical protein
MQPEYRPDHKLKRAYNRADWEKIGLAVKVTIEPQNTITNKKELELTME